MAWPRCVCNCQLYPPRLLLPSQDGGTILTIFGTGFMSGPSVLCRFTSKDLHALSFQSRSVLVLARFVSSSHLECPSPRLTPGITSIDLTFNGHGPFSEDVVEFEQHPQVRGLQDALFVLMFTRCAIACSADTAHSRYSLAGVGGWHSGTHIWCRILRAGISARNSEVLFRQPHRCSSTAAGRRSGGLRPTSRQARFCSRR